MPNPIRLTKFVAILGLTLAAPLALAQMQMPAQTPPGQQQPMQMPMQGQAMRGQSEGEVTRILKETNRMTLKHGPIQGMDMGAMTMVFQVKDPLVLDKFKVGDKVKFTVVREGNVLFAETIEPVGGTATAPAAPKVLEALPDPHAGH